MKLRELAVVAALTTVPITTALVAVTAMPVEAGTVCRGITTVTSYSVACGHDVHNVHYFAIVYCYRPATGQAVTKYGPTRTYTFDAQVGPYSKASCPVNYVRTGQSRWLWW